MRVAMCYVTCVSRAQARRLAAALLAERLVACVNLFSGVESHYWWKDKIENASEVLLMVKSSAEQFEQLRELVSLHHAYACPEVVAVKPEEMAPAYRQWWKTGLGLED